MKSKMNHDWIDPCEREETIHTIDYDYIEEQRSKLIAETKTEVVKTATPSDRKWKISNITLVDCAFCAIFLGLITLAVLLLGWLIFQAIPFLWHHIHLSAVTHLLTHSFFPWVGHHPVEFAIYTAFAMIGSGFMMLWINEEWL